MPLTEVELVQLKSKVLTIVTIALEQTLSSVDKHGGYASMHEAYGVLKEEVREYEDEVFKKDERRSAARLQSELLDVACVAIKAAAGLAVVGERHA